MTRYVILRVLQVVPQVLILTIITFGIVQIAPGTPGEARVLLGRAVPEGYFETLRAFYGVDRPPHEQYINWLKKIALLDFGRSFSNRQPVTELIRERLGRTIGLMSAALGLAVVIAIPIGVLTALYSNSLYDHVLSVLALIGVSMPSFWFAVMMIGVFAVSLRWLPAGGVQDLKGGTGLFTTIKYFIMPVIVLALSHMASLVRYVRSSIIEVLGEDYIRTARAKGLPQRLVLIRHALRNALIPVVTILGLWLPGLVGGAAVVEMVFSLPGVGRLTVEAAYSRDYPITMAMTVLMGLLTILGNLLADIGCAIVDPRIRLGD